jgi:hypothetical protein
MKAIGLDIIRSSIASSIRPPTVAETHNARAAESRVLLAAYWRQFGAV